MDFEVPNRIHREELKAAVQTVLSRHFGAPCEVRQLRRRRSVYSSSSAIENLEVELERGQGLRLVLKDLSPAAQLPAAQRARPAFLNAPMREIGIYGAVLQPERWGTAVCYGAIASPKRQQYWLFLERISGPLLWQRGRLDSWKQAARWLGRWHSEIALTGCPAHQKAAARLLRYDEAFYGLWLTRAEKFLRRESRGRSRSGLRRFGRLAGRYERVIRRLLALPTTFIHGEFYPSNILLRAARQGPRICPIDWEMAALAPGMMDVAALTAGDWRDGEKQAMIAAYREALAPAKSGLLPMGELEEAVDFCQLHQAVQMLGWAADWPSPEHQRQNWLGVACRLADKLGL